MAEFKGIDVSHHNGTIDWEQVQKSGVKFAIAKATQGTTFKDPNFTANVTGANNAGIAIGAYHYGTFTTVAEARSEAAFFLSVIKQVKVTYAVSLDLEVSNGASVDGLTDAAIAFMTEVRNAGYTCLFYTYKSFLENNVNENELRGFPFWIARYNDVLGVSAAIWQYSSSGQVPGISGNVDLDTAYEDFSTNKPTTSTYTVYTTLDGYVTAEDAKNHKNPKGTVKPGDYYVFNTSQGMINVTSQKGVPGSWINPNDNKKPTTPPSTPGDQYVVNNSVPGYVTAEDAKNHKNPKGTVSPGTYYVFNTSQGMINVTLKRGVPGSWINPADNKITSTPAPTPSDKYVVKHNVPGYVTAEDAKNHKNPKGTVSPGTYYVFNTSQGMINVTSQKGSPGSWINPADN